ncbi:unnamed protein product [Paramecium sonneborni]|uniref:Uncharacterized protein n=1 Tax=Paramecium sonneborni TaxID=65129 RepID=A0A8S1L238_9CILI|nr:unnamed protein product [Paramecium sonneborni]
MDNDIFANTHRHVQVKQKQGLQEMIKKCDIQFIGNNLKNNQALGGQNIWHQLKQLNVKKYMQKIKQRIILEK